MYVTEQIPETTLTLTMEGELDHHRTREVIEDIREKIDCMLPKRLVLDLRGLSFSDSSGIAVLLRLHRSMMQVEGVLEVVGVQPQPLKLFETAGLHKILSIRPINPMNQV